jgi:type II secretory pathway component GspD/PulD (secretin)
VLTAGAAAAQQPAPVPALVSPAATSGQPRSVLVQLVCVRVPDGFLSRVGLTDDGAPGNCAPCVLTPREVKMFGALLRAEPGVEILARPQLLLAENKTGFFQVGEPKEVIVGLEAVTKDGTTLYAPKTMQVSNPGLTLRLTPRFTADGKSILLKSEATYMSVSGAPALIRVSAAQPADEAKPRDSFLPCLCHGQAVVNQQSMQMSVLVPDGGTVAACGLRTKDDKQNATDLLWLMTAHAVAGAKQAGCDNVK